MKTEKKRIKKPENIKMTYVIALLFVIPCAILLFINVLPVSLGASKLGMFARHMGYSDYLEILGIHYTTVFLTTSLMSTLGESADFVYYENIIDKTLLEPNGFDFYSLSVYAFLTIVVSTVATVVRSPYVFLLSFVVGIATVIFLFFKMVGIYFRRSYWEDRILKEMTGDKIKYSEFCENVQRLRFILESDIENNEKEKVVTNLAFIIELMRFFADNNPKNRKFSEDKQALDKRSEEKESEYGKKYDTLYALYLLVKKNAEAREGCAMLDYLLQVIALLKKRKKEDAIIKAADFIMDCLFEYPKELITNNQLEIIRRNHRDSLETAIKQKEELLYLKLQKVSDENWVCDYEEKVQVWSADISNHLLSEVDEEEDLHETFVDVSCDSYTLGKEAVRILMARTYPNYAASYFHDESNHLYTILEKLMDKDKSLIVSGKYSITGEFQDYVIDRTGLFIENLPVILNDYAPDECISMIEMIYTVLVDGSFEFGEIDIENHNSFAIAIPVKGMDMNLFETECIGLLCGLAQLIVINGKDETRNQSEYIGAFSGILTAFWFQSGLYKEDADARVKFYSDTFAIIGQRLMSYYPYVSSAFSYALANIETSAVEEIIQAIINDCADEFEMGIRFGVHPLLPPKDFDKEKVFENFLSQYEISNPKSANVIRRSLRKK